MIERGTEVFEACADAQHEAWSHWMAYLLDHVCVRNRDGNLAIPTGSEAHWRRQIATPYAELTDRERESDREQVDRYAHLVDPGAQP